MNVGAEQQEIESLQRLSVATEWVLRLRDERLGDEDIAAWLRWCEADPRNQHAFDRAQNLWTLTRSLSPASVEPRLARAGSPHRGGTGKRWAWMALAASVIGAAMLLIQLSHRPAAEQEVVVARAAVSLRRLPDGSSMQLAAGTAVAVRYSKQQRELELRDGEVYFTVAHDTQRPFVVSAGDLRARAVGTAFNVRRAASRIVVTVTQGTVDVWSVNSSEARSTRLQAGSQIAWSAEGAFQSVSSLDPKVALAWREGRLNYDGEPLEAVVADVSRYSERPVRAAPGAFRDLYFTGTVFTSDTEDWIRALPSRFDVRVRPQADGSVVIERRAPARR